MVGHNKWRIRWRQDERQADGSVRRKQRETYAYSSNDRKRLEADIEQQLVSRGWWEPESIEGRSKPLEANAERVAEKWLQWKMGTRRVQPATIRANLGSVKAWFKAVRTLENIGQDAVVSGRTFSVSMMNRVATLWREASYADGTVYQWISAIVDLWTWAYDQPDYTHVIERPPTNRRLVLPPTVIYEAPPDVATWAETDACLRHIRLPMPRRIAIIMRYTGLRLEQAVMIHREDIDVDAATLLIRKGKSRREQGLMRRVPVSRHLLNDLGDWLFTHAAGPLFPDLSDPTRPMVSYRNQTRYVTEAWAAATEEGEVRKQVWMPVNRVKARPDHAFRASFQSNLLDHGISDTVIDWLVGHAPSTTRGRHYAQPAENALRRAVDTVTAVDWKAKDANVLHFDRRARA
jgi:integrase